MSSDSNLVLAENVRRLMDASGDSQVKVAKRGGLSQRNVGNVVTYGTTHTTSPTVRTVDGLAKAFGVAPWILFVPEIPLDLLQSGRLDGLMANYVRCPESGRANIERTADSEVRWSALATREHKKAG